MNQLDDKLVKLKAMLDETMEWPNHYMFKFIVPVDKKESLIALIGDADVSIRPSKKGNYMSVTVKKHLQSSEDVITIYLRVSSIEGIISL